MPSQDAPGLQRMGTYHRRVSPDRCPKRPSREETPARLTRRGSTLRQVGPNHPLLTLLSRSMPAALRSAQPRCRRYLDSGPRLRRNHSLPALIMFLSFHLRRRSSPLTQQSCNPPSTSTFARFVEPRIYNHPSPSLDGSPSSRRCLSHCFQPPRHWVDGWMVAVGGSTR